MSAELAMQIARAGEQIILAPAHRIAGELNRHLNQVLGWPFRAASGVASDRDGRTTAPFATLIFTRAHGAEVVDDEQPANIAADTLACVVDATHTLDLEGLRQAYARIAQAKALQKSPAVGSVTHTTITFGVVFAVAASIPLEQLADELDRLNRQMPSSQWPDMVVVASYGLISYAVQFPGEPLSGQWMPPATGALANYVPAIYVVMIIKPSGGYTLNQMIHTVLTHLWLFSPGADLPDRDEIIKGVQNPVLTQSGYQYDLAGELRRVPPEQMQGRMLPQRPSLLQDQKGETLATLQFLKWQDGGVILLGGKLPLDGLMVFLGGTALTKAGTIRREGLQLSHVLPITERNFQEMLRQIQRRSNMIVRNDPGKFVVQRLADEGTSTPFMARLFLGVVKLGETLPDSARRTFAGAYEPLINTMLEIRTTAKELADLYADHTHKIETGSIVQMQGPTVLHITESIDRPLRRKVDEFLSGVTRSFKDRMQRVTKALGAEIGFLYQKSDAFERGVAAFAQIDGPLAAYLREARRWGDALIGARNGLEHHDWQLPRISYVVSAGAIVASEPTIDGQPVTSFVNHMTDRLLCFVEDVTVHCIQRRLPAGLSITEIPLTRRTAEMPMRFQPTLTSGGMPIWKIRYHQSTFDAT
jgi:hypothetical protein